MLKTAREGCISNLINMQIGIQLNHYNSLNNRRLRPPGR